MHLQSGIEHGVTLGTPIGLLVKNEDQRPHDYSETDLYPRPSHADYTYLQKYGIKASSGGGRSSARETIGLLLRCSPATRFHLNLHEKVVLLLGPLPRSTLKKLTISKLSHSSLRSERFACPHPVCLLSQMRTRIMTRLMMRFLPSSAHYSLP